MPTLTALLSRSRRASLRGLQQHERPHLASTVRYTQEVPLQLVAPCTALLSQRAQRRPSCLLGFSLKLAAATDVDRPPPLRSNDTCDATGPLC